MSVRHALSHPAARIAAALALSCAVIAPAAASAYTKNPPEILSTICVDATVTFTWDTSLGKPSTWAISDGSTTYSGRFSKSELTNASKSVAVSTCGASWGVAVTSGKTTQSVGVPYTFVP